MNLRNRGFALILVIWSLVILSGLATGFVYAVRLETRIAGDVAAIAHAEAAGEAALRYAVLALSFDDGERRWDADGQLRELRWGDAKIRVAVEPESGRIDLNRAQRDLLAGLFAQLVTDSEPEVLADAVIDWRDRDEKARPLGAEEREYESAGYAYGPTNRPFTSIHELSQVMGFDREKLEALVPYITVHSRLPRVNAITADLVVLAAIPGISRSEAAAFIDYRKETLAAGETLRIDELRAGRRYLDTRPTHRVYSLEIEVALTDGFSRREHIVIETDPSRGYTLLARDRLPAETDVAQGMEQEQQQ